MNIILLYKTTVVCYVRQMINCCFMPRIRLKKLLCLHQTIDGGLFGDFSAPPCHLLLPSHSCWKIVIDSVYES